MGVGLVGQPNRQVACDRFDLGPDVPTRAARTWRHLLPVLTVLILVCTACVSGDNSVQTEQLRGAPVTEPRPSTPPTRSPSTSAPAPATPPSLGDYELSDWEDCDGGFQCATLDVPLNWDDPGGATVSLSVIRKPASGPGERLGSALLNPGGPGEPGTGFLRDFADSGRLPQGLGARFDLISWDPRGTGDSAGIRCSTDAELLAPSPDPTPDSPADTAAITAEFADTLAECKANSGKVLPYVGTVSTVRDLDALRAALGDERLTYIGYSYGTTIGTIYAEMFPQNIRAMVLDGVTMVGGDPVEDTHEQARSFEKNLEAFLAECASRSCLFGKGNPRQAFLDLVAELEAGKTLPGTYSVPDSKGAEHQRRGTAGIGEFYTAVFVTLYGRENWPALEQMLAGAANGKGDLMLYLRDQYEGRQDDGSWNHILDANVAINCADQKLRPDNALGDPALRVAWTAELPLVGGVFATGTPGCTGWPASIDPLPQTSAALLAKTPPLVVIGATGDPATPYQQAVTLSKQLPDATLVTWEAEDHTAYGRGSKCLDTPVTDYLVDLTQPANGIRCKP